MENSRLRILYHHRTRGDGAEGVHIKEIIIAFRELGHKVEMCCPPMAKRPAGLKLGMTGLSAADSKGLAGVFRLYSRQLLELGYNIVSIARLLVTIIRFRPGLIYERYSCYHFAGILLANIFQIPIVLEVNSTYAGRFERRLLAFPRLCRWIENYALRNSTLSAAVSNPIRDCIIDHRVDPNRSIVTPNAINESAVRSLIQSDVYSKTAKRAELGISQTGIVIGFVGSLRRWHGVDVLVKVIPRVLESVPDAVFLIVGAGELEDELSELQSQDGIGERLVLTGGVSHSKVNGLILAMDIGLMPHSNNWGSPMKILEYMSQGKISIAPRLEPIEEIVQDGVTGLLFRPGNEKEFIEAIVEACQDETMRDRLGMAAQEYVLKDRKWTDNATAVFTALEKLSLNND